MTNLVELTQNVLNGNSCPLKALALLRDEKKVLEECISLINDQALEEAQKHGGKTFEYNGYKFECRSGKKRYSFDGIKEYDDAIEYIEVIKEKYKQVYNARLKGNTIVTDEGEILPYPKVTFSKDSMAIKKL